MRKLLLDLGEQHPSVGDVRSIGLFGVVELVKNRETREPLTPYNQNSTEMNDIRNFLLDNGVYVYTHWHTILIIPPLIISEEQITEGFRVLDMALEISDKLVK